MPKTLLSAKTAKKVLTAHKKVAEHRADKAGTLRRCFDGLSRLTKLLADLHVEGDQALKNEIDILQVVMRRFRERIAAQQKVRTQALALTLQELGYIERLLREAQGRGYSIKRLAQESERDLALVKKAKENLNTRQREAAFVLAELEQAVDPTPGLKLANAKRRKENDDRRKKAVEAVKRAVATPPPVPPAPDVPTS